MYKKNALTIQGVYKVALCEGFQVNLKNALAYFPYLKTRNFPHIDCFIPHSSYALYYTCTW